jgi:3-methyladenine DNA glycosylase/8-oxoguanine DNA glycosylase
MSHKTMVKSFDILYTGPFCTLYALPLERSRQALVEAWISVMLNESWRKNGTYAALYLWDHSTERKKE